VNVSCLFLELVNQYKNEQGQNCRGRYYMRQNEFEAKGSEQNVGNEMIGHHFKYIKVIQSNLIYIFRRMSNLI